MKRVPHKIDRRTHSMDYANKTTMFNHGRNIVLPPLEKAETKLKSEIASIDHYLRLKNKTVDL